MEKELMNNVKTKAYRRGNTVFVFIANPFDDATMQELMPLLTPEQMDFINTKNWNADQKLRRAQAFADENVNSVPSDEA